MENKLFTFLFYKLQVFFIATQGVRAHHKKLSSNKLPLHQNFKNYIYVCMYVCVCVYIRRIENCILCATFLLWFSICLIIVVCIFLFSGDKIVYILQTSFCLRYFSICHSYYYILIICHFMMVF